MGRVKGTALAPQHANTETLTFFYNAALLPRMLETPQACKRASTGWVWRGPTQRRAVGSARRDGGEGVLLARPVKSAVGLDVHEVEILMLSLVFALVPI
jgi:hypothetical protein